MVRNAWEFGSRLVVQVWVSVGQIASESLQTCTLSIVQDDNTEFVLGIVLGAGSSNSVQDQIIVLTAASDKDVDRGHVVTDQPQLGPGPLFQSKHGPEVLHENGDGDADLDSDEDPGERESRSPGFLSCEDKGNS